METLAFIIGWLLGVVAYSIVEVLPVILDKLKRWFS